MLVLVVTMAVHPRCWTSCCFHLSSVMDLADNFNAFPTSEVKPSCPKSSFPGACEVVVTTKTRIHCRRALYYVIMLFNTWKLIVLTWLDILKATKHTRAPVSWSISRLGSNHCSNLGGHFFSTKLYTIRYKDYKNYVASKHDDGGEITNYVFFSDRILPNPAFWLATERSVTTYRCFYATITLDANDMLTNFVRFVAFEINMLLVFTQTVTSFLVTEWIFRNYEVSVTSLFVFFIRRAGERGWILLFEKKKVLMPPMPPIIWEEYHKEA